MISYGLTALILYIAAIALYLLVQRGLSPLWRRRLLHLCLASSLLIPLLLPYAPPKPMPMGVSIFQHIPEHQLQAFCQCDDPQLSHRVFFRTYSIGIWLTKAAPVWLILSAILLLFWVIKCAKGIYQLHQLVQSSEKTRLDSGFWQLIPRQPTATSACWWGRPYIILGPETASLTAEERRAVIAHERSHLHQGNTIEQLLYQVLTMIWFWNPLIWWTRQHLICLSEYQADDAGMEEIGRKEYIHLLIRLHTPMLPVRALRQGISSRIYRRIQRLISSSEPRLVSPVASIVKPGLILTCQLLMTGPVQAGISQTLSTWHAYEQRAQIETEEESLLYCPDCETICLPEETE